MKKYLPLIYLFLALPVIHTAIVFPCSVVIYGYYDSFIYNVMAVYADSYLVVAVVYVLTFLIYLYFEWKTKRVANKKIKYGQLFLLLVTMILLFSGYLYLIARVGISNRCMPNINDQIPSVGFQS